VAIEIFVISFLVLVIDAIPLAIWGMAMDSKGLEFCNPYWLYQEKELCVFSCVFVAVFANITVFPYALGYWFYKACSTRRKSK
jgi:hypothetical protein